nr:SAM-dependent methyltransferase [Sulfitobacter aestuariivivens]
MRLDDYMSTCLLHPTLGYYTTRAPFGQNGDFITAPEISQMFGELLGLALAQAWMDQGAPPRFTLAEMGPGRGTLMADALRATSRVPGFAKAAEITLFEASPALQRQQYDALKDHTVSWITDLQKLPDQPLYLLANEFFDALPIRQFVRNGTQWRERQVGATDGTLTFGLGPVLPQPALQDRLEDTQEGDLVETCAPATATVGQIAGLIARNGGAGIIIDYGDWRTLGDTFQAVRGHEATDPLAAPGHADLTAHVDFEALTQASDACRHTRITPQGVFLERLGITARAQSLAENLRGPALDQHIAAHRRLTHPEEMGNLFKVMGLYPQGCPPPPGLEP